jgi:glycine/sarcosine N-methyltransferase
VRIIGMSTKTHLASQPWADEYHAMFADWYAALAGQSKPLTNIIENHFLPVRNVLDGSCGVGVMSMGLAAKGYTVHACDISPQMVEECVRQAEEHGLVLSRQVADLRTLDDDVKGTFDCTIVFNGFPHLKTDEELQTSCNAVYNTLRKDGLLVASIRDYDSMLKDQPSGYAPRHKSGPHGERITFQKWDWEEGLHHVRYFTLDERDGQWSVKEVVSSYRPLRRSVLTKALQQAGFEDILWLMPEESGFEQPIVTARAAV